MQKVQGKYNEISISGKTISADTISDLVLSTVSPWEKAIFNFLTEWWNKNSFIEIKTSGSTGKPKLIRIEKEKMVASALMTGNYFGFKEDQNALLCLPAEYIAGRMMIIRAMVWKMNLISVEPLADPLEKIKRISPDFAAMIPLQVVNCINNNPEKLSLIKKVIIGGGEIPGSLNDSLQSFENSFYATYGMTETITHVAIKKLNGKNRTENFEALPGITFSTNEHECLIIDAPQLSAEKIVTNDIVDLKNKTSFEWLGRRDNVINSGGKKFYPEQLEKKTEKIIPSRYFFTSLPDEALGNKIVLVIEGNDDPENYHLSQLEPFLSRHELPKTVLFTNEFRETATGKINRAATLQKALASR